MTQINSELTVGDFGVDLKGNPYTGSLEIVQRADFIIDFRTFRHGI